MRAPILLLAAAVALAAGCGGNSDDESGGGSPASTPTPTAAAEDTATPPPATSEETPTLEAGGSATIAEGQGSVDEGRVMFRITELQRSGPTVVLNAMVEMLDGAKDSLQVSDTFSNGVYEELEDGTIEGGHVFDGVALVDPEGRKKYLVARDETGRCVCSNDLSGAFVKEDGPVFLEATLTAPPEGVTEVDVIVPNVKTFTDVPISQ
jgi:hypothetical protein